MFKKPRQIKVFCFPCFYPKRVAGNRLPQVFCGHFLRLPTAGSFPWSRPQNQWQPAATSSCPYHQPSLSLRFLDFSHAPELLPNFSSGFGSTPMVPFWGSRCITHFGAYFSGWRYGLWLLTHGQVNMLGPGPGHPSQFA